MNPETTSEQQLGLLFEPVERSRRIWPVAELVERTRGLVERDFADVWVEGEISNCRPAASRHVYFTLKDDEAQLPVVLFRRQAALLRFEPRDGMHVLVRGRVSVYAQRGQLQLMAETMEPVGVGSLQLAFEQLKEKLRAEGLFDAGRKRALPAFPRTVAIVTSPAGAVVRDFLNIVARRHSGLNVLVVPVAVQGEAAAAEIESALLMLNANSVADLVVIARGGGSLEDLAAFNSERVARAIAAMQVAVISAVGHETDFSIADFVADLRAPTPSAAAEIVTDAHYRVGKHIAGLSGRLERGMRYRLIQARQQMDTLHAERIEWQATRRLHQLAQRRDELDARAQQSVAEQLRRRSQTLQRLDTALHRQSPARRLAAAQVTLTTMMHRLTVAGEQQLRTARMKLQALDTGLHALSPLAVLDRGYALVQNASHAVIRSAEQVSAGEVLTTRLGAGSFTSTVAGVNPPGPRKQTRTKGKR